MYTQWGYWMSSRKVRIRSPFGDTLCQPTDPTNGCSFEWMNECMQHFPFRKLRCGSSGKTASIPQLSTLQGIFRYNQRKNLPTHGLVQRHSQGRPGADVSLFRLWMPVCRLWIHSFLAATYRNCMRIGSSAWPQIFPLHPQVSVRSWWEDLGWILAHRTGVSVRKAPAHLPGHGGDAAAVSALWVRAVAGHKQRSLRIAVFLEGAPDCLLRHCSYVKPSPLWGPNEHVNNNKNPFYIINVAFSAFVHSQLYKVFREEAFCQKKKVKECD